MKLKFYLLFLSFLCAMFDAPLSAKGKYPAVDEPEAQAEPTQELTAARESIQTSPQENKPSNEPLKGEEKGKENVEIKEAPKEVSAVPDETNEVLTESAKDQTEPETPPSKEPPDPQATQEVPAPVAVPAPSIKAVHTVWVWQETKDSLWELARRYYGDPWKWKQIYLANQNTILDPTVIFPKQKIVIPSIE